MHMGRKAAWGTTIAALCCLAAASCSFFVPGVDPKRPAAREPLCGSSSIPPTLDALIAGASLSLAVAIARVDGRTDAGPSAGLVALPFFIAGLGHGLSALAGFSNITACKDDRRKWQTWKDKHPDLMRKIRCDHRQKRVLEERDPAKRAAMMDALPVNCRGRVDQLVKIHSQVLAAVTNRQCYQAEALAGEIKELSEQYYRTVLLKDPQLETCIAPVHVDCAIVGYKNLQEARVQLRSDATIVDRAYKIVVSVYSQGEVSRTGVVEGTVGPGKTETRLFRGFPLGRTLDSCSVAVDSAALDAARVGPVRLPAL